MRQNSLRRWAASRSREGAWIEMRARRCFWSAAKSRSREGAWIEIYRKHNFYDLQDSRSREGAWIEIADVSTNPSVSIVAPARERGLKF